MLLLSRGVLLIRVGRLLKGRVCPVGFALGREVLVGFLVLVVFVTFVGGVGEHVCAVRMGC